MLEYLGQLFTNIDYFQMGAFPLTIALSVALSLIFANDNMENFLLGMMIINTIFGIGLFIGTKNSFYLIGTVILIIIMLIIPNGAKDYFFKKTGGGKDGI